MLLSCLQSEAKAISVYILHEKACTLQEEPAAALLLERTLAVALRSFACPVAWYCHATAWQARQVKFGCFWA